SAGKHGYEAEDLAQRPLRGAAHRIGHALLIDDRQWYVETDAVDDQEQGRDQDLPGELGNLEDRDDLVHSMAPLSLPFSAQVFAAGGFILLRTGFLGGGITSMVPPLALIFSAADLEKWCALTFSCFASSPSPRIRTPSAGPLARPALSRAWGSTV